MNKLTIEITKAENGYVIQNNGKVHVTTSLYDLGDICRRTVEDAKEKTEAQDFESRVRALVAEHGADAVMEMAGRL